MTLKFLICSVDHHLKYFSKIHVLSGYGNLGKSFLLLEPKYILD